MCTSYLVISFCVVDPRFVGVHQIPESDNPEDDKIYLFFKENAIDGEHAGKATHARIGQLCKVRTLTHLNTLPHNPAFMKEKSQRHISHRPYVKWAVYLEKHMTGV